MSTQTSDSAAGLDPAAVEEWILALGLGAEPPLRFARAGSGKSNLTYLVTDLAGKRWILRRPPTGPLLPSAHDVAREHRILGVLEPTRVPSLAVRGFTGQPSVTDALGLWKIAIICEGVRRRASEDERNAARTSIPAPQIVDGLVRQAQLVAFEAGLGATR